MTDCTGPTYRMFKWNNWMNSVIHKVSTGIYTSRSSNRIHLRCEVDSSFFIKHFQLEANSKRTKILCDLFYYALNFARSNTFNAEQISAFLSILKRVHTMCIRKWFVSSQHIWLTSRNWLLGTPFSNMEETYQYFKALILKHSLSVGSPDPRPFHEHIDDHLSRDHRKVCVSSLRMWRRKSPITSSILTFVITRCTSISLLPRWVIVGQRRTIRRALFVCRSISIWNSNMRGWRVNYPTSKRTKKVKWPNPKKFIWPRKQKSNRQQKRRVGRETRGLFNDRNPFLC